MFSFFYQNTISKQISLYIAWKAVRFPGIARTHERVLREFFGSTKMRSLDQITSECLKVYCNKFPAQYQRLQFIHVMKQFSRYWRQMGILSSEFTDFMTEDTIVDISQDFSPTMHTHQVRRVRAFREQGYSLDQIRLKMETEDGKPYHKKQIHRWSKYVLPDEAKKLSTPS